MGKKGVYDVRKTKEQFIIESKEIHGDKYDYSLIEYVSNKIKVKIVCQKHGIFEKSPKAHLQLKQGCPSCSKEIKKQKKYTFDEFVKLAKQKYGGFYDYEQHDYLLNGTVIVICPNHGKYEIKWNSHLNYKCKNCYYQIVGDNFRKSREQFIVDSEKLYGKNSFDYSLVDYKNNRTKIKIICKNCKKIFEQSPSNHLQLSGCTFCSSSKGERIIESYLLENNIKFQKEHMFPDCKNINPLRFDFYLEDFNLCIEFDGIQHYDENSIYWNENTKRNDIIKNTYCKMNSIRIIRIPYYRLKSIKSHLNKVLSKFEIISLPEKKKFFVKKSKEIWFDKYDYSQVDYIDESTPVTILYKGLKYRQTPSNHLKGIKCENSNKRNLGNENFILKSKKIWKDRFNYSECEYLGTNNSVKLYDNLEKKWIWQIAKSHLKGFKTNRNSSDDFMEKINHVHEFKFEYDIDYKNLHSKIIYICPLHGEVKTKCYSHLYGGSCTKCDEYKFNTKVSRILNKLGVSYSRQKHFHNCRDRFTLPFDFHLSTCNIMIEYDGIHKENFDLYNLNKEEIEKIKMWDKIKSDYCEDSYINLIRIRWDELDVIEDILNPYLKPFFINY